MIEIQFCYLKVK